MAELKKKLNKMAKDWQLRPITEMPVDAQAERVPAAHRIDRSDPYHKDDAFGLPVNTVAVTSLIATQEGVYDEKVAEALDAIKSGVKQSPVLVYQTNGSNYILDGHHRAVAHIQAKRQLIDVAVIKESTNKYSLIWGLRKNDSDTYDKQAQTIVDGLLGIAGLKAITSYTADQTSDIFSDGAQTMLGRIGVADDSDLVNQVFSRAVTWADANAAQLVTGVDQTTRDRLTDAIADGLEDNVGYDGIVDNIVDAGIFDEDRAELIARTEITRANQHGALEGMRQAATTGLKVTKEWYPDDEACEDCQANADQGPIDLDDDFDSGDDAPPAHPNCECSLLEHTEDTSDDSDDDSDDSDGDDED